jgi:N-acetylated-alpha-linked acidic dipeptidase
MAVSERTPLLVVQIAPRQPRYPYHGLRRFCTFALGCLLVVAVILFLCPFAILPREHGSLWDYLPWAYPFAYRNWPAGNGLSYHGLQSILQNTPSAEKIREWSGYYTAGPHLAGKNLSQAIWTKEKWREFGIEDVNIVSYDVYLSYPLDHHLALLKKNGENIEATFVAALQEDVLLEDHTSGLSNRIPTFHGYSASGNITAQYIYANFGTYHDFDDLLKSHVSLEGKIALVKYGKIFRGLKVKRAQDLGMAGVIIYTDPQEDGEITELGGYEAYPNGPARNPSAVQRGSVQFLSMLLP